MGNSLKMRLSHWQVEEPKTHTVLYVCVSTVRTCVCPCVFACICDVSTQPVPCFIYKVLEQVSRGEGAVCNCACVLKKCATPLPHTHNHIHAQAALGEGHGVNYSSHIGTTDSGPWRGAGPATSGCSAFITELATGGADFHRELARTKLELTGLQGRRRRRRRRKIRRRTCASGEWREKELVCGRRGGECVWRGDLGGMKETGVFERKCWCLTWPWGPIMGLLGLCGGGCAWGDCWEPGGPFKKEERCQRGEGPRGQITPEGNCPIRSY